jgi:hypothetical protein
MVARFAALAATATSRTSKDAGGASRTADWNRPVSFCSSTRIHLLVSS